MPIIVVAATKGGAGKTTTAVLTALALASAGHPIRVLDTDRQGSAARWAPEMTDRVPQGQLAQALRALPRGTIAVIDTPPEADPVAMEALRAADLVIAPTKLGPVDLQALVDLCRMVDPDLVVPVAVDRRRSVHVQALGILAGRFGDRLGPEVPSSTAVEQAQTVVGGGVPLRHAVSLAYKDIAARIVELLERKANGQGQG